MKLCKSILVRLGLISPISPGHVPAYGQRGTLDIDAGEVTDKFGAQPQVTAADFGLNGQVTLIQATKDGGPSIVAGGELRVPPTPPPMPASTPSSAVRSSPWQFFHRRQRPGPQDSSCPTLTWMEPSWTATTWNCSNSPSSSDTNSVPTSALSSRPTASPNSLPTTNRLPCQPVGVPHPNFDYGYTVRGSVGYNFGKWYVKGTYETRYFKFASQPEQSHRPVQLAQQLHHRRRGHSLLSNPVNPVLGWIMWSGRPRPLPLLLLVFLKFFQDPRTETKPGRARLQSCRTEEATEIQLQPLRAYQLRNRNGPCPMSRCCCETKSGLLTGLPSKSGKLWKSRGFVLKFGDGHQDQCSRGTCCAGSGARGVVGNIRRGTSGPANRGGISGSPEVANAGTDSCVA